MKVIPTLSVPALIVTIVHDEPGDFDGAVKPHDFPVRWFLDLVGAVCRFSRYGLLFGLRRFGLNGLFRCLIDGLPIGLGFFPGDERHM